MAERVKADTLKDLQKQRAKTDAEAFLAEVQKGASFNDAASPYNVSPAETDLFGRNAAIPEIGNELQVSQAAFELTSEKPLAEKVLEGRKGMFVIRLKERQTPDVDDEGFDKEKTSIVSRLTEQKRQTTYQAWLEDLKSRGKVKIEWELIKQ